MLKFYNLIPSDNKKIPVDRSVLLLILMKITKDHNYDKPNLNIGSYSNITAKEHGLSLKTFTFKMINVCLPNKFRLVLIQRNI